MARTCCQPLVAVFAARDDIAIINKNKRVQENLVKVNSEATKEGSEK